MRPHVMQNNAGGLEISNSNFISWRLLELQITS